MSDYDPLADRYSVSGPRYVLYSDPYGFPQIEFVPEGEEWYEGACEWVCGVYRTYEDAAAAMNSGSPMG